MVKNIFIQILTVGLIGVACSQKPQNMNDLENMIQADRDFNKLSIEKGRNHAFKSYCADSAVILTSNSFPVVGKNKIIEKVLNKPDSSYTLSWEPESGFIAESGELGYTYGIWEFNASNNEGEPIQEKGTYCTIWKKDNNGKWKWVLDTGNDGLR